jgi:acetyl-CoA acetyltransferase
MSARSTAFMGVGFTPVDRDPARSLMSYAMDAALDAIADAGLRPEDIDGYVGSPAAPAPSAVHADGADEVSMYLVAERLGLRDLRWVSDVQGMPLAMAVSASAALRCGDCRYVLGLRAMYRMPDRRYAASPGGPAFGEEQFRLPFGHGPGGTRFATRLRRYLELSGASREDLYEVVATAREHARLNPVAYWRDEPLTRERYLDGRMIADPLCIYDCDLPVCGAGAFVLSTGERAADGPHRPAGISGYANWTEPPDAVFGSSGVPREHINVAQIYDGYSGFVYHWLEELGWCEPNEAWRFVSDGRTRLGGELPVNTFGGSLGEGRLHGIGHLREAVLQVSERAGARQVGDAEHCLVQVGPPDKSWLMVVSGE